MKRTLASGLCLLLVVVSAISFADSRRMTNWFSAILKKGSPQTVLRSGPGSVSVPIRPRCFATTCEAQGKNCGSIPDGCGGSLDCGGCSGLEICGGGGQANVCGQTCYKFAYKSKSWNEIDNIFEYNVCTDTPLNMTGNTVATEDFSRLNISPNFPELSFHESGVTPDGRDATYMNLLRSPGGWNLLGLGEPPVFAEAIETDFSSSLGLAIVSKESDGRITLRINENASANYPPADSRIVLDNRLVAPSEVEWIPLDNGISSRRLVVSTQPSVGSRDAPSFMPSRLYVVQLSNEGGAGRAVPLEDGINPGPMAGFNPAPSPRGSRLLFVKSSGGSNRIFECDIDVSELERSPDTGRAFCRNPQQLQSTNGTGGDYGSPCWSYDAHWVFYAYKGVPNPGALPSTWDIYRDRYISGTGARFQREGIVVTSDADESEVVCYPLMLEAVTQQSSTIQTYQEPAIIYQGTTTVTPYQVLTTCSTDSDCLSSQVCRDNRCQAR